jgi:hypothetical protein
MIDYQGFTNNLKQFFHAVACVPQATPRTDNQDFKLAYFAKLVRLIQQISIFQ